MAAKQTSLSVVIPVYNSASMLPHLVERLEPVLADMAAAFDLILVNDGSQDHSWTVISQLAETHPWIRGIDLMRNYGQHNALLCGIAAANHAVIITMDDDLQHPPENLPTLLERLTPEIDVVYGTPAQEQHGLWRNLASQLTKWALQRAMGVDVARQVSALRVFRATIRDAFIHYSGSFVSLDVLLTWGTTRFAAVKVPHDSSQRAQSNYTFGKLVKHALNMMTGFSTLPIQLASGLGIGLTLFGVAGLLVMIGRWIGLGGVIPGFAFLAATIAIFSGVQLIALGIIGEYLARMHFRIMERPAYTIRQEIGKR